MCGYNTLNPNFTYDICFNNWPLEADKYSSSDYKKWLKQAEQALGGPEYLYKYWADNHEDQVKSFVEEFVGKFNELAELCEYEVLPPQVTVDELETS